MAGGAHTDPARTAEWASSLVPEALVCCFILDFYFVKVAPTLSCFVSPWETASFLQSKARCPDLCLQWIGPRLGSGLLTEALYITELAERVILQRNGMKRRKGKAWTQSRKDTLRRDTVAWLGGLISKEFLAERKDWVLKVPGWGN